MLFWWSRAAFVTKEISGAADQVVHARHLLQTAPFNKMIPIMELMAALVYGDTDGPRPMRSPSSPKARR